MGTIRSRVTKGVFTPVVVAALTVSLGGVAAAISGGSYRPGQQDCPKDADAYNRTDSVHGCHTFKLNLESGDTRYGELGIDQMPTGDTTPGLIGEGTPGSDNFPHAGCAALNLNGTGGGAGNNCGNDTNTGGAGFSVFGDLNKMAVNPVPYTDAPDPVAMGTNLAANGLDLYLGADDNLDGGEHDGVDNRVDTGTNGIANGPSDGGAVTVFLHPQDAGTTPGMTNPLPGAGAAFGSCADGVCEDITTYHQLLWSGTGTGDRDAANYKGKHWDPFECSSGDRKGEQACDSGQPGGPRNMNDWRAGDGNVYAQPGLQIYEDPDPQASPIDPIVELEKGLGIYKGGSPLYPLPGIYVGTCGVIIRGGVVMANPVEKC